MLATPVPERAEQYRHPAVQALEQPVVVPPTGLPLSRRLQELFGDTAPPSER